MNWAVILAGGRGTRFWPASRLRHPKQLLSLASKRPSLLEETVSRIKPLVPEKRIIILTQKPQYAAIRKVLPGIPKENFVVEPVGRNTAPALGLAAFLVLRKDPKAALVCLPADHLVENQDAFLKAVRRGIETASSGSCHVTFGIPPTAPETGFGYIESGEPMGKGLFRVRRFVEKPDLERAKKFLKAGNFFWNSGMFVWRADWLLASFKKSQPRLFASLQKLCRPLVDSKAFLSRFEQGYSKLPAISIDYALMEKAKNVVMVRGDFGWSDLGSWTAFESIWPKDSSGNARRGEVISVASSGNLVDGDSRLVALLGVENLVVVSTEDALLVARKDRVQEVRKVIEILEKRKMERYL